MILRYPLPEYVGVVLLIIKLRCVAPRSNVPCVYHSTHYIICNLQIVDIYQNIRPPKKKCLKTLRTYHSSCFPSWSCGGQECLDGVPDGLYRPNGS